MEEQNINENIEQVEKEVENTLKEFIGRNKQVIKVTAFAGVSLVVGSYIGRHIGRGEGYTIGYRIGHAQCFNELTRAVKSE